LDLLSGEGRPPEFTIPDLLDIHEDAIRNHPRTLQRQIGPSSLGSPCDRCLIRELAGLDADREEDAAWLPELGHAVHHWFDLNVLKWMGRTGSHRYINEGRVAVGEVGGVLIEGNSDVYDTETATVVDYKVVGTTTLREVRRNGAKTTYIRQGHCYGLGWERAGFAVQSIAIWFVPRNGRTLRDGHVEQFPYNRNEAIRTVERADMFARAIQSFGVDAVLAKAPPHTGTEFSCPDPKAEQRIQQQLDGLIPTE
jgi:hypothetical protein